MLRYRPDDDEYTDGILTNISNAIPTNRGGYHNAFDSADLSYTSLPGTCLGSNFLIRLDGTRRFFAGTSTRIYEADQTSAGTGNWTDVSRATTYSTSGGWTFAQFGDVSLAASYENRLQFSNGAIGTDFADVAGAPNAKVVYTLGKRVILLNTSGYTGSGQDGWAASSEGDYFTSAFWPPAATNNAAFGTLNEVGGPILAGCSLGSLAIAWKSQGMWIGQDQGPPVQITWQKIPGDYGIIASNAWCYIEGGVFFVSRQDAYIFDGARPISVTDGVKNSFFSQLFTFVTSSTGLECSHDEQNNCVYIFIKSSNFTLVYNYRTREWGRVLGYRGTEFETIQAAVPITSSQVSGIYGLTQGNSNSSVRVFANNKLRQLGTNTMRSGTTAQIDFNWFRAQRGSLYYKNLHYRAPILSNVTLSGFANLDSSEGALTSNLEYQRLDAKYSAIILKPRMTITPSSNAEWEFTGFGHDMKQEGAA